MPYYIGDVIKDKDQLIGNGPEKLARLGANVLLKTRIENIIQEQKKIRITGSIIIPYDVLVIAAGSRLLKPGIPGEDKDGVFTLRKLKDAIRIKSYLEKNSCKKAIIVGAGFIGMEMCEALRGLGMEVKVVNQGEYPVNRWDPELSKVILSELEKNNVEYFANQEVTAIEKGPDMPLRLITRNGHFDSDMILLAVGIKPDVQLAFEAGIDIGGSGAIAVNFSQHTSAKDVYAVGDCCEVFHHVTKKWVNIPLSDIAHKQALVAGSTIGGRPMTFSGAVGSQSFRIFKLETAATGIDVHEAQTAGFSPVSHIHWGNAISRVMGERKIGLKLVADKTTGKLLGAQAIGETGVVGRINALAVALWSGLRVDEISQLDFAYAPPFSPSWDVIHTAAQELLEKM